MNSDVSIDTRLGRIEGKLDVLLETHKDSQDDHEARLRALEGKHAKAVGVFSVVSIAASALWSWVMNGGHHG